MHKEVKSFEETNALGKDGERIVQTYLRSKKCTIEDLSDDSNWRAEDVDMCVTYPDGELKYIEVKTDTETWLTGNIFLEISMERLRSGIVSEGWFYNSLADDLTYVCAGTGTLYVFSFEAIREYVRQGAGRFTRFPNRTDPECIGSGVLVSVAELRAANLIRHEAKVDTSSLWKHHWSKPVAF